MAKVPGVIKKELPETTTTSITSREITKEPKISTEAQAVDRVAKLKSQGYIQVGDELRAPEIEYISYWTRQASERQTGTYSPHVLTLNPDGTIAKEVRQDAVQIEASSTGGWAIREVRPTSTQEYDYAEGVITTTPGAPPPQTFLATSQAYGSDIPVGRQLRAAEIQQLREAATPTPTPTREPSPPSPGFRRFVTDVSPETGRVLIGAAAGDVAIFKGTKAEREEYLRDPRSYEYRQYLKSVERRVKSLEAQGVTRGVQLFPKPTPPTPKRPPTLTEAYADTSLEGMASRIEESMAREQAFLAQPGVQRIRETAGLIVDIPRMLTGRGPISFEQRGFVGKAAEITVTGFIGWPIFLGAGTIAAGERIAATGEALARPETRPQVFPELKRAGIETAKVFDPRTPEGAATLVTAGVFALLNPALLQSSRFLRQVKRAPPPRLKGRTFFGTEEKVVYVRGDVLRKGPGIEVREPGKIPFERRITRTPEEILTTAVGKDTFIVQEPTGRQISTVLGKGEFKDYFLRTVTEPTGVGRTQVFRAEPEGFRLLKTLGFKTQEGVVLTEALPAISKPKGEPFVEEMKAADVTLRIKQEALAGKILPTTRDGYVPEGTFTRAYTESIKVATDVPKLELVRTEKSLKLEFAKTQFELVEYKPVAETAVFETVEGISKALKPVEFTQIAETKAGQVFDIQFRKLGKPPRPREAVKPPTEPPLAGEFLASFGKPAEKFTPFEYPAPEPFKGVGAKTLDISKIGIDTKGADVSISPQEVVQRVQIAKMEAPALRDIRLFTEPVPGLVAAKPVLVSPVLRQVPIAETLPEGVSRADVFSESIAKSVSESISESLSEARSFSVSESESLSKSVSESLSRSLTETMTLTQTMTQTLVQAFAPRTGLGGFMPPAPGVPMLPPEVPPFFPGRGRNQDVFNVLVREAKPKGKARISEVRVNEKPIPYNKALNVADRYVDETSARTFRLVKVGRKEVVDDSLFFDEYKYRRAKGASKINPKSYIEKSLYAIDSAGERREISARGLLAQEKKRRGFVKRLF